MINDMPLGLQALAEKASIPVQGPQAGGRFTVFTADFGGWLLSLSNQMPCVWLTAQQLAQRTPDELVEDLLLTGRLLRWQNERVFVFVDGETAGLTAVWPMALAGYTLLGQLLQQEMAQSSQPQQVLWRYLRQHLPLTALAPYEISKPVTSNRFFGRQNEIDNVLQHPDVSYLFVGIRRIGKTSLLKEIKRQLDQRDPPSKGQVRRVYIDCTVITNEEDLLRTLIFQLEQSGHTFAYNWVQNPEYYRERIIEHYVEVHGEPITFLLDEFDRLLVHLKAEWRLFQVMKTAVLNGQIRLIAAGFRDAMDASTNEQSPFFNLLTPVRLRRLTDEAVAHLVLAPLQNLGIAVQAPAEFVQYLIDETAGFPSYIQHYCYLLLQQVAASGARAVSTENLRQIRHHTQFRSFLLSTFMANTALEEQALVYALIDEKIDQLERSRLFQTIDDILQPRRLAMTQPEIDQICRNLEMAGVFKQVDTRYEFAVPLFQELLQETRDVGFLFERARESLQTEKVLT